MGRPGVRTFRRGPRSFPLHHPPADWASDGGPLPPPDERPRRYGIDVRTTEPAASHVSFSAGDLAGLSPRTGLGARPDLDPGGLRLLRPHLVLSALRASLATRARPGRLGRLTAR
ncbi:hypothetical protein ABT093_05745 [Kitasatospora sp. NPDC002551]|uniref:hypothetical protein n=1 Tax=Kitasatospora sp. NPDC002551 TaxID=3154539 RepID=UPI00332C807E